MTQVIPDTGQDANGEKVTLSRGKNDDLTVVWYNDAVKTTTNYSHHPMAIDHYRTLVGLPPIVYAKPARSVWANTEHDGHEHDWEWNDADNDDDNGIHCGLCGVAGELETEE